MRKFILLIAVGIAVGAIADHALAIAWNLSYHWTHSYATSNGTITAIWNAIDAQACSEADSGIGMPADTCSELMAPCSPGTVASLTCQSDGTTDVAVGFDFGGDWTPDATP